MIKPWFIYVVRCSDNSLYTGITTDVMRRVKEHNTSKKGARYTRSRRPVTLAYVSEPAYHKGAALRGEQLFRLRTKTYKEFMCKRFRENVENGVFVSSAHDIDAYRRLLGITKDKEIAEKTTNKETENGQEQAGGG